MRRRGARHGDAGQSLAELAIALPVLLAIAVGIFEFGRAWNVRQVLVAAAREGARMAVVPSTASQSEVEDEIDARLAAGGLEPADVNTSIEGMDDGIGQRTTVTLTTEYTFQFLGPVVGLMTEGSTVGGTITLTGTAVMRNE